MPRFVFFFCALALAGCCANNACDCQDLLADAVFLRFDVGSGPGQFAPADVDTVYLLRYAQAPSTGKPDSLAVVRPLARAGSPIVISNTAPFAPGAAGRQLNSYYYTVFVQPAKQPARRTSFFVNQIRLRGRYRADGCCTCYENLEKSVAVNGVRKEQPSDSARAVVLSRP